MSTVIATMKTFIAVKPMAAASEADETTFTVHCPDNRYTEPERYEAARVEADRQFEKLMRMLEARRKSTE